MNHGRLQTLKPNDSKDHPGRFVREGQEQNLNRWITPRTKVQKSEQNVRVSDKIRTRMSA